MDLIVFIWWKPLKRHMHDCEEHFLITLPFLYKLVDRLKTIFGSLIREQLTQQTNTCSTSTIEILQKDVKSVQS